MSRIFTTGYETSMGISEQTSPDGLFGGALKREHVKRSGRSAAMCDSGSGGAAHFANTPAQFTSAAGRTFFVRVYFCFLNLPNSTVSIIQFFQTVTNRVSARLTPGGKLQLYDHQAAAQIGSDSSATIVLGQWYRVELSVTSVGSTNIESCALRLDGAAVANGNIATPGVAPNCRWGWLETPGDNKILFMDDAAGNDSAGSVNNSWPGDGKVILMRPISDAQVGSWTGGAGGTSNLFEAVNNAPPIGTASETDLTQIESVDASGNNSADEYRANCGTYLAAGIADADVITAIQTFCCHGEDVATGTKVGSMGAQSNPVETYGTFNFGLDSGALSTHPTNWRWSKNTVIEAPSVDKSLPLILGLRKTDAGTAIAACSFIGVYVDYIPAAVTASVGPNAPGSGANVAGANADWINPGNVLTDNAAVASVSLAAMGNISDLLAVTNFGFSFLTAETILGIVIEVNQPFVTIDVTPDGHMTMWLTKNGSVIAGTEKVISQGDGWVPIGGDSDLWGTTLTPAEVNASTFGALFKTTATFDPVTGSLDAVRAKVYYLPVQSTPISGTDSGFGVDDTSLSFQASASESSVFTDASILGVSNPGIETGLVVEVSTLAAVTAVIDTGTSSENGVVDTHATLVSGSDTGSGTDAVVLKSVFSVSDSGFSSLEDATAVAATEAAGDDSGVGTEIISQFTRNLPDFGGATEEAIVSLSASDAGTSSDSISALARALQDAGSGVDAYAIVKTVSDVGAGTDVGTLSAALTGSDAGTGSETSVTAARLTGSDTGAATDASLTTALVAGSDSGSGADSSVLKAVNSVSDTGSGSDAGTLLYGISVTDTGSGVEVSALVVRLTFSDTGTGVETHLISLLLADSAIGSEVTALSRVVNDFGGITETTATRILTDDSGSGAEVISAFPRPVVDSGLFTDDSFVSTGNERTGSDSAEGDDTALVIFKTTVSDVGAGSEISNTNTPVNGSETGTFVEVAAIRTSVNEVATGTDITSFSRTMSDTGTGIEGQSISTLNSRQDTDSGTGTENYILEKELVASDSGVGSENQIYDAGFTVSDSGSSTENATEGAAPIRIEDNGQGSEVGTVGFGLTGSDSGIGVDKGHAGLFVEPKFHESILISANGEESVLVSVDDPYIGV